MFLDEKQGWCHIIVVVKITSRHYKFCKWNTAMLIEQREYKLSKTSTRHRKDSKQSGIVAIDICFPIILDLLYFLWRDQLDTWTLALQRRRDMAWLCRCWKFWVSARIFYITAFSGCYVLLKSYNNSKTAVYGYNPVQFWVLSVSCWCLAKLIFT